MLHSYHLELKLFYVYKLTAIAMSAMTVNEVTSSNVWDISDIERESNHWTLSSDVNMLQFLQTFSDNMMSKLNSTSESLEQLICFTEVLNNNFN